MPVRPVTKSPQVAACLLLTQPVRILCTKDNLRVSWRRRPLSYGCHSKCLFVPGFLLCILRRGKKSSCVVLTFQSARGPLPRFHPGASEWHLRCTNLV